MVFTRGGGGGCNINIKFFMVYILLQSSFCRKRLIDMILVCAMTQVVSPVPGFFLNDYEFIDNMEFQLNGKCVFFVILNRHIFLLMIV